ncbi:hypothetical protein SKAU_G00034440 [Synaphobranchus kaupii]|uniref:Uncharacterized protein n=1 Tax=Synaphobranchus kaupii TaxID=118154 RepID=A0A9Q1GE98_SYNKA|nr:hypothetical protein SKAU_G00034440 [Synaphobranchus kaupii]
MKVQRNNEAIVPAELEPFLCNREKSDTEAGSQARREWNWPHPRRYKLLFLREQQPKHRKNRTAVVLQGVDSASLRPPNPAQLTLRMSVSLPGNVPEQTDAGQRLGRSTPSDRSERRASRSRQVTLPSPQGEARQSALSRPSRAGDLGFSSSLLLGHATHSSSRHWFSALSRAKRRDRRGKSSASKVSKRGIPWLVLFVYSLLPNSPNLNCAPRIDNFP